MAPPSYAEVWDVDFGNPVGHEQGEKRPAVVVSADWFNATKAELHTVVPISGSVRALGTHLAVDPPEGGLEKRSDVMCEHIRSVALERFVNKRGEFSDATMEEVVKRLKVLLLLGRKRG